MSRHKVVLGQWEQVSKQVVSTDTCTIVAMNWVWWELAIAGIKDLKFPQWQVSCNLKAQMSYAVSQGFWLIIPPEVVIVYNFEQVEFWSQVPAYILNLSCISTVCS